MKKEVTIPTNARVAVVEPTKKTTIVFHSPEVIEGKKRATVVGIMNEKSKTIDVGVAVCSPKDSFQRKLGVIIAEGRAMKPKSRFVTLDVSKQKDPKKSFYDFASKLSNVL